MSKEVSSEKIVKDIRRKARKKYSAEEKIRIVLDELRGEESIAALCRKEGVFGSWQEAADERHGARGDETCYPKTFQEFSSISEHG